MMTKEELADLLINNTDEFNEAIKTESPDLSEMDFSGATIEGVTMEDVDLTSSSFADSQLTDVKFINCDLTSVDFTRTKLVECTFTESVLNGTDFSYAVANYCNFSDSDLAGTIFSEADLSDSDFTMAENLNASRFDDTTIWPDSEYLPNDFDSSYTEDLSSLKDDEDIEQSDY